MVGAVRGGHMDIVVIPCGQCGLRRGMDVDLEDCERRGWIVSMASRWMCISVYL